MRVQKAKKFPHWAVFLTLKTFLTLYTSLFRKLHYSRIIQKGGTSTSTPLGVMFILLSLFMDGVTAGVQKRLKADLGKCHVKPKPYGEFFLDVLLLWGCDVPQALVPKWSGCCYYWVMSSMDFLFA